jgi:hypothetical protein
MMSFIDDLEKRLNLVFAESSTEPTVIDMGNPHARDYALANCKGPHIGWRDYVAGKDYQPPTFSDSSVPVGPPDENNNPHSAKYGGVRPWSKEEVIETVIQQNGLADRVMNSNAYLKNYIAGDRQKRDTLKSNAAHAIDLKLWQDEARDNKFLTWIYKKIFSFMAGGGGQVYGDEYRVTQGTLDYWNSLIGKAVRPIRQGQDISEIINILQWGGAHSRMKKSKPLGEAEGDSGVPVTFRTHDKIPNMRRGYMQIDTEKPGEWNEFGNYAVPLYNMGETIATALASGDLDQVYAARQQLKDLKARLKSEYDDAFIVGARGEVTAPSKPGGYGASSFHVAGGESGKEMERTDTVDRLEQAQTKTAEQAKDVNLMKRIVTMTSAGVGTPAQEAVNAMAYLKSILSSPVNKDEFAIQEREDDGQRIYDVLSPNGALIQSTRNSVEAQEVLDQITPGSVMADDIDDFSETLGMQYGKYLEPFKRALDTLSQGLKNGDNSIAQQGLNILGNLKPQAEAEVQQERQKTGKKAKPGDLKDPPVIARKLSATEYRFLLRWYNITNYPERGTENDPEMINGEPSNWKQAGYPEFTKHKKTTISRDLGFGKQRGGQVYKAAIAKMKNVVQAAYGDMGVQLEGVSPNHTILKECIETITRELVRFFIIDD